MTVETQVFVVNGVTTNTYSGDGLRRSVRAQGASPVTFVWDCADYLMEKS